MSARAKNSQTPMSARAKGLGTAVTAALLLLSGCAQPDSVAPSPSVTLAPPTPSGMVELPPEQVHPPMPADDDCDVMASLRPFDTRAEAEAAVADIKARGRLIVGLDVGSNLFSFRDPITGKITGFDVDIAGEIARDIFGTPSQVEYRILSSEDRIAALERKQVDVVVKTMAVTCKRKKLVNFSTVYLIGNQRILVPKDSGISGPEDLSGKRVCVVKGTTSLERIQEITPPPIIVSMVTWADCLVAMQQSQVDAVSTDDSILAGLVSQDPYLRIVGPSLNVEPYGVGINLENIGLVRFVNGTLERIRKDGTWNTLYRKWLTVLGPAPTPPVARYSD